MKLIFAVRGRGEKGKMQQQMEILGCAYTNAITTVQKDNMLLEAYDTNTTSNE